MTQEESYFEKQLRKYARHPIAITHRAILDLTEEIVARMEGMGLSRSELARRAKMDPARITRVLSGEHNVTLATLGMVAAALDVDFSVHLTEAFRGERRGDRADTPESVPTPSPRVHRKAIAQVSEHSPRHEVTRGESYLERLFREYARDPIAITERAILHFTDEVAVRMKALGLSRSELARRAKMDPARITRVLDGNHNLTLATLGKIAAALDMDFGLHLIEAVRREAPKQEKGVRRAARSLAPRTYEEPPVAASEVAEAAPAPYRKRAQTKPPRPRAGKKTRFVSSE
ncbi:MAG: helix-turn-helix domain-containing protein [Candidatus Sumerlaeota bacterium]|nr:helix-turn-helix domain-containing protein [Candidatus Sumerlaeota bacterium]